MRRAVFGIIAACGLTLVGAPTATADPPPGVDAIRTYPLARGIYSSPDPGDFYKVFFKTPDGRFCGISPNGGDTGCDAVPIDAPGGTNDGAAATACAFPDITASTIAARWRRRRPPRGRG